MNALDNGPMGYLIAEEIAADLVAQGYSARAYPVRPGWWGYQVVVTGTHGKAGRFRYVVTDAAQLPKAIDDLAAGLTGGSNALEEGAS